MGAIDSDGVLVTGTKAGEFAGGLKVQAVQGATTLTAQVDAVVRPDPLATVEIEPSFVVIERNATQQFTAAGFDQYRNEVPLLDFLWASGGGEITQAGMYTASDPGSFSVTATARRFSADERIGAAVADVPLVAYWPGDGNADDVVGGNHGRLQGGVTFAPGKVGQAFSFDGVDDFMSIGQPLSVEAGTVGFWVNRDVLIGDKDVFFGSYNGLNNRSPIFVVAPDDTLGWGWEFGNVTSWTRIPLLVGEWHHLAITWQRLQNDLHSVTVYSDGAQVDSGVAGGAEDFADLFVGALNRADIADARADIADTGFPWTHARTSIDEVRIYNRALTDDEIKALFEAAGVE